MQAESLLERKYFRWFAIGALVLLLVGLALKFVNFEKIKIPGKTSTASHCVDLPERFDRYELPEKEGCYRLKLDPKKYSGKIILPLASLDFRVDFENPDPDDWAEVITHLNSKPTYFTPATDVDIGNVWSVRKSVLQYRGKGALKIYIQPLKR